MANNALGGLARQLVQAGHLDEAKALYCQEQANQTQTPLISYLVQKRLVSSQVIMELVAQQFGLPCLDLDALDLTQVPKEILTEKLMRQYHIAPLKLRGHTLYVGISDPLALQSLSKLPVNAGITLEAIAVQEDKLNALINRLHEPSTEVMVFAENDLTSDLDELDLIEVEDEILDERAETDGPVIRFVNKLLIEAVRRGASDLHFEPYEHMYRARFRIDGLLHEVARPPVQLIGRISARLKVMSRLDIAEKRRPQDGRIKLRISKQEAIDFRVSTLPTLWGEKVVMRILDSSSAKLGIDALGYEDDQKQLYLQALKQPQGMILVTGPTGSGKTVSLYTGLNILNTADVNISTIEDPVEINMEGINQVNVNIKQGMDFSNALRAFLRQDPDIIMVGEIRDLETAEIAIKAAQTGHLVLSTLHTNSAAETLTRLHNMGIATFNIATSVSLIIAQRLARKLCPHCKQPVDLPPEVLREEGFSEQQIGTFTVYAPVGCNRCSGGYKGRTGIYEVVRVTPSLQHLIMSGANSLDISQQMRAEGFRDLRASGLRKVMQGITSLEEMNRVTKD